jgi:hypothetical protein
MIVYWLGLGLLPPDSPYPSRLILNPKPLPPPLTDGQAREEDVDVDVALLGAIEPNAD